MATYNKLKFDAFGGFNPIEAYSNFAKWFVEEYKDILANDINNDFLKSASAIKSFKSFCEKSDIFDVSQITAQSFTTIFFNAVNLYKVLEIKDNKYQLAISLAERKNNIFHNLANNSSAVTKAQIAKIEQEIAKFNSEFLNNIITNQKSDELASAFDGIFWAMAKKKIGNNARAIFTAFSLYKQGIYQSKSPKTGKITSTKKIHELYKLALTNKVKWPTKNGDFPEASFNTFIKLMTVLGLASAATKTITTLDIENVKYDPNTKKYSLAAPLIPTKYGFSEEDCNALLNLMKDKKINSSQKGTKYYLKKYATDPKIEKTDVDVLFEYLCGLKLLYSFNVKPEIVYKSNFLNRDRGTKGSQPIVLSKSTKLKINTQLDRELIPYNTAAGGVADIVCEKNDLYFSIEPCVYTNPDDVLGHETNGVKHLEKDGCMILVTLFELSEEDKNAIWAALKAKNDRPDLDRRLLFATCDTLPEIISQIKKNPQAVFDEGYDLAPMQRIKAVDKKKIR